MLDRFIDAAGTVPARRPEDRWRQVALLGLCAAADPSGPGRAALAGALVGLDLPVPAKTLTTPSDDNPWGRWWAVLATGQAEGADRLAAALSDARSRGTVGDGGREVARRISDLTDEIDALATGASERARFVVLGHQSLPLRRMLIAGRSSATFLVEPSWDGLRLVRLGPTDGPALGNAAQYSVAEIIGMARRGDSGHGRPVPSDAPTVPDPQALVEAMREVPGERDERLLRLATEVREERERLNVERLRLEREREEFLTERARARRAQSADSVARPAADAPSDVPTTKAAAARLLGVDSRATDSTVERAYRTLVASAHPDRVAGLDPRIRARAEEVTVALNAARDLLVGRRAPARAVR